MEKIKQKDFIEIEFTGKVKDGDVFDSNIKEDLEEAKLNIKPKPFIFCVGEKMFLETIDDFLVEKEIGKKYEIELEPEKAFGKRNSNLVKIMPIKLFQKQQTIPQPGMAFNFDGQIGKIISVSGGRVITDFNNPLAGKTLVYNLKVKRKITEQKEKASALIEFFTKTELPIEIKEKKLIVDADERFAQFLNLFKDKFKEILDLDLEVIDKSKEKKEVKEEEKKEEKKKDVNSKTPKLPQ